MFSLNRRYVSAFRGSISGERIRNITEDILISKGGFQRKSSDLIDKLRKGVLVRYWKGNSKHKIIGRIISIRNKNGILARMKIFIRYKNEALTLQSLIHDEKNHIELLHKKDQDKLLIATRKREEKDASVSN